MIYLTPGFRKLLADDKREYLAYADITLANNQVLHLTNTEIWQDGFQVEEAVSEDNTFGALGAAVIGAGTLVINNTRGEFTQYDFLNADVVMSIALMIDDTTPARKETVKMGTFRVDDARYDEVTITLSLLDLMEQFDRPYSLTGISYPATLGAIIRNACTQCGVGLATLTFPRYDYTVQEIPADEACTYRDVIGWVAALAGCYAKCNRNGDLVIQWFNTAALEDDSGTDGGVFDSGTPYYQTGDNVDGGTFNPWNTGDAVDGGLVSDNIPLHYVSGLYAQDICVDETVITGVEITVEDPDSSAEEQEHTYTSGTPGYVVQIEKNPFITMETAQDHADWLGNRLIGLHFRKCTVQQTDDPAIEAGDVGLLFDAKNNEFPILISRVTFEIGGPQTIVCASDTPAHNSATQYSSATKSYAELRKRLKNQINSFDVAMNNLREDIRNAKGLYADEIEDPDNPGSTIYVLHDNPSLAQSPVRIMVSSVGVTVTSNGTDAEPDWYGLRVNGDMITRIMNTIGINFDWGTGGTLTLGGQNNINGKITMLDENNQVIGEWDKDGADISGIINNSKITDLYDDYATSQTKIGTTQLDVIIKGSTIYFKRDGVIIATITAKDSHFLTTDGEDRYYATTVPGLRMYFKEEFMLYSTLRSGGSTVGTEIFKIYSDSGNWIIRHRSYLTIMDRVQAARDISCQDINVSRNAYLPAIYFNAEKRAKITAYEGSSDGQAYTGIEIIGKFVRLCQNSSQTAYYRSAEIATVSSSSKRYKHDIKPIENKDLDPHRLLELNAVQFVFNDGHPLQYEDMAGKELPGFIAEEVDEIYPSAAIHKNGKVESWDERRIIPGMLALIQEQDKRIQKLEQDIEELKALVMATGR